MQGRELHFARWFMLAVLLLSTAAAAEAQRIRPGKSGQPRLPRREEQRVNPRHRPGQPPAGTAGENRGGARERLNIPPRWLERLRQATPEEQERFLRNNERFRQLPQEEQERIRENLRRWNNLTPEQRRELERRGDILRQLTPEQREHVRRELMPRWQSLEPHRRQAILRRLGALRDLSDEERAARLNDENFLHGMNEEDRELLRQLNKLRVGPAAGRPEPVPDDDPPKLGHPPSPPDNC